MEALQASLCAMEAERAALDALEASLAAAHEQLSQDPAVQAAYAQGRADERHAVLLLLEEHQHALQRGGLNAISLETLRRRLACGHGPT